MLDHLLPIFAVDVGDVVGYIIGIAVFVLWLIGQLSGAGDKNKVQRPAPPKRPPQAARPGRAPQGADAVRNDVEEFLRRAGRPQKAAQAAKQPRQPRRADVRPPRRGRVVEEIELLVDDEVEPSSTMAPDETPKRLTSSDRPAYGESVAEHVAEHIAAGRRTIGEHAAHLGDRVTEADQQFDTELKAKFDHDLGSLSERRKPSVYDQIAAVPGDSPAGQIAALLASPKGVRQAILLNEILRRPEERW